MFQRLLGVFVSPVRTFTSLDSAPHWIDALVLSIVLVSVSTFVFTSSETGARLTVDRRVIFAEAAGHPVSAGEYAMLIAREQHGAALAATFAGFWLVVLTLVVAAGARAIAQISIVLASSAPGMPQAPRTSPPRFRHALSIAAHGAVIMGLATPCRLLLNVWAGAVGPSTSIGVLLPFLPADTIWAHLGNSIDLFGIWWTLTLATGFAVIYLRRPEGLRLVFLGIYLLNAVALAATKALVGAPSF
jgi:hypothetical protein